ncbi:MAG: N-6 DNA methylase [Lachnospiraceae bacterium]
MNPPYGGHEDKSIQGFFPDDLASSETADLFMSVILYRLKKNGRAAVVVPDGFLFGLDNAKVNIKKSLIVRVQSAYRCQTAQLCVQPLYFHYHQSVVLR